MIAPTSFFADYGNHIRIWQEARALQGIGHRVVIATYHNGDDMPGIEIHRSWDVPWIKRAMVGSSRHKIYLDAALSYRALALGLNVVNGKVTYPGVAEAFHLPLADVGSVL